METVVANTFNQKILVVDDLASMRGVVCSYLKSLGYSNLHQAEDGVEAMSKLRSGNYEFVMSDWNMPKMTGIELLREIRKHDDLKHIPVLLVTAEAKRENIMEAIESGVTSYIVKPFTPIALEAKLKTIFEKRPA